MAGGLGFADSLTKHIFKITAENTPQFKLNWQGHLNLLKHNKNASVVRLNDQTAPGHRRTVVVKARQRATVDMTDTTKSCDNVNTPAYFERDVNLSNTRQYAIYLDDETIARYPNEASANSGLGTPSTSLMNEFMLMIKEGADAILSGVNQDVATLMAAAIGTNQRTGNNNASAINLVLDGNSNPLNQGTTQILTDYQLNEASGRPMMVGTGLIHNYMLQQRVKSPDQSGVNTPIQAADFDFFQDPFAGTSLGANQAIVYEPETVQLVEYMEYQGFKAGDFGVSTYFTFFLPMQVSDRIEMVEFDAQLKYYDCPTTLTDAYYGTSTITVNKGWSLIISKQFGLFTVDQAYRATDRLNGNRGSYRYSFTNV